MGRGVIEMKHVATALLFDRNGQLLIYLRDDKPTIPFPNHWDLFGGHVEPGELPEEALIREIREELAIELSEYRHIADFECIEGDVAPNTKHVFVARTPRAAAELVLQEGQRLEAIDLKERHKYKFANVLGRLIDELAGNPEVQRCTENLTTAREE
jgi:mutator protein MutT